MFSGVRTFYLLVILPLCILVGPLILSSISKQEIIYLNAYGLVILSLHWMGVSHVF